MSLKDKFQLVSNERAVLVGAALSVAQVVGEFTVNGKLDWHAAVPAIAGVVIRQFVYGPKAVNDAAAKVAHYDEVLQDIIRRVNAAETARQAIQKQQQLPPDEGNAA